MGLRLLQWVLLLALGVVSLLVGSYDLTLADMGDMAGHLCLRTLEPLTGGALWSGKAAELQAAWDGGLDIKWEILRLSRLPRLGSILVAGSSLAIAGLIMQRITNNRFVSPTTAGTMEWCRFGVMIAILYMPDASPLWRVGAAFLVALVGTSCFLAVIARVQNRNVILVPLIGMMLGGVVNAGATFYAYQYDVIQNMTSWLQGSFALIVQGDYELLYASVPLMLLAYVYADLFTIAGMGREATLALGLNHASIMRLGLVIVSVISAITIVEVGYLPFVGLIVPNIVSLFRGDDVRKILFDTAWLGAALVLGCDVAGRLVIPPFEVPIGVIMSVLGGALFLMLILNRRRHA